MYQLLFGMFCISSLLFAFDKAKMPTPPNMEKMGGGEMMGKAGRGVMSEHDGKMPSKEQHEAMQACLEKAGVKMPKLTDDEKKTQKKSMEECHQTVKQGDHEAMHTCMTSKGVNPPPRPDKTQMEAMMKCRKQVFGEK
jgi:hypothetical protein